MDFTPFVQAVKDEDNRKISYYYENLYPKLLYFLYFNCNATAEDSEDCVQQALADTVEAINNNKIRKPESIFSYLCKACKNNYLRIQKKRKADLYEKIPDSHCAEPNQEHQISKKELNNLVLEHFDNLKSPYKELIYYFIQNPDASTMQIGKHFGISKENVWTRKHRALAMLEPLMDRIDQIMDNDIYQRSNYFKTLSHLIAESSTTQ